MAKERIATFLAPNKGLSIAGNHAYAYSGVITVASASSADTTALKFTTGNNYFVGDLSLQSDENAGNILYTTASLNGSVILAWKWDLSSSSGQGTDWPQPLLIPPNTEVEIKVGAGDTVVFTVQLVGKVYQ